MAGSSPSSRARRSPCRPPASGAPKTLVLYGRADGTLPGDVELGCDVTGPDGGDVGLKVSTLAAIGAEERTVGSVRLTPLATVRKFSAGWLLACSGPAARARQPLYLLGESRPPLPSGSVAGFAVLSLVLGAGALLALRGAGRAPVSV